MVKQTKAAHRMGTSGDQPLTRDHAKQVQHEQWVRHQGRGGKRTRVECIYLNAIR